LCENDDDDDENTASASLSLPLSFFFQLLGVSCRCGSFFGGGRPSFSILKPLVSLNVQLFLGDSDS
jgi:hypothetical protein